MFMILDFLSALTLLLFHFLSFLLSLAKAISHVGGLGPELELKWPNFEMNCTDNQYHICKTLLNEPIADIKHPLPRAYLRMSVSSQVISRVVFLFSLLPVFAPS